jgi:hypothetical protein
MSSRQMKEVEIALEVDAAATSELNLEVRPFDLKNVLTKLEQALF